MKRARRMVVRSASSGAIGALWGACGQASAHDVAMAAAWLHGAAAADAGLFQPGGDDEIDALGSRNSMGNDSERLATLNQMLSELRARSVQSALQQRGDRTVASGGC